MRWIRRQKAEGRKQKPECGMQKHDLRLPAAHRPRPAAFTLIEMLVVMGIIVLAVAMAIPTIRYLTGSKSEQAAQNAVAAMLTRARTDAVGTQQPGGIIFLLDQASDRVVMREVMQTIQPNDPPGVTYLDLVPDRDPLYLPPGVRAWTIKDVYHPTAPTNVPDPFPNYRYLGFNDDPTSGTYTGTVSASLPQTRAFIGGVILFDGYGNLLVTQYGFRYSVGGQLTALGNALVTAGSNASPPSGMPVMWPASSSSPPPAVVGPYLRSQLGVVLFDRETFRNVESQITGASMTNFDGNPTNGTPPSSSTPETYLDGWLDQNTTPLLVNNYNGTLSRGE